jgi:hypothetical protein
VRTIRHSTACGAAALALGLAGAVLTAPPASASSENYIGFTNSAGYFVDTCYEWKGPDGIESKNYCQWARPVGTSWKAYFPAEATGATVIINLTGSGKEYRYIDNADKNHCFETTGVWPNGHVLGVNC